MSLCEVHRGPGNHLVALGKEPVEGNWIVRTGDAGKRLRLQTVPVNQAQSLDSLRRSFLTKEYEYLYEGRVDGRGNLIGEMDTVSWEGARIDPVALRQDLVQFWAYLRHYGCYQFADNPTGTSLQFGTGSFGLSRSKHGHVDFNGCGAGEFSFASSSEIGCLIAWVARCHDISFSIGAENVPWNRVLSLCSQRCDVSMSEALSAMGYESISTSLNRLSGSSVGF